VFVCGKLVDKLGSHRKQSVRFSIVSKLKILVICPLLFALLSRIKINVVTMTVLVLFSRAL